MDETDHDAVARLRATAHPVRLRILSLLTAEAMSAAEVARTLEITHANASYHLRLLHDAGELVVESEEKIRGGVAKRYRYDATREVADRSSPVDDRIAYARATALEVERRLLDAGARARDRRATSRRGCRSRRGAVPSTCCTRPPTCSTPRPGPPAPPETVHVSATHQRLHDDRRPRRATPPAGCRATEERPMTWARGALAPLRNRNFAWYFASRFVNTLGTMMANIALTFAVLDIDGRAIALGRCSPRTRSRWSCCCSGAG